LGYHLLSTANPYARPAEIVGIVSDARENGIDRAPLPTVYYCYSAAQPGTYFIVRTHGAPMSSADTVRRKIHEVEPLRSVFDLMPLEQHTSESLGENRMRTILLTFFAVTAVSLACVGLFGLLSYVVNLRRREVGLRIALGAERRRLLARFLMQGLTVSAAGCLAGVGVALGFSRVLAQLLYGVSAYDPPTLFGVVGAMLAVAAAGSFFPALRAARVEPMQVLRDE